MDTTGVSQYLRELRKQAGFTQQNVAEKLNVSPQAVSKWERAECLPDITLLPEIAAVYGIRVEDILQAGGQGKQRDFQELLQMMNSFVNDELFQRVVLEFHLAETIAEVGVPLDFFMVLNGQQKEELLDCFMEKTDFHLVLDDLFQYINTSLRTRVIRAFLMNDEYETVAPLIPYTTKRMRTEIVEHILQNEQFDFLEEVIPFLNREQKDWIIDFGFENRYDMEYFDAVYPFFDMKQRKRIEDWFDQKEDYYE